MRLKIDGCDCPLAKRKVVLPSYRANALRGVQAWREGESVELWVVATPEMELLFGHAEELYSAEEFNSCRHDASIELDGVELLRGIAALHDVEFTEGEWLYHVVVRAGGAEWADNVATTHLNDSNVECDMAMTLPDVRASWVGSSAVRMLPLVHDNYPEPADTGLYVEQRVWGPTFYHPFISVKALIESTVSDSGYTLKSDFLASPLVEKLVLSGAYHRVNTSRAIATMGFRALRSTSTTATAAEDGRVDAWVPIFASNVGAIVDTVAPDAVGEDGELLPGAYAVGGCFTFEDGRPSFRPTREISVAFDIGLRYTTDYRIISSTRLRGFDTIYLGNGCYVEVELPNRFKDRRYEIVPSLAYKLMIFDYDPSLTYVLDGVGVVSSAESTVTFNSSPSGAPVLRFRREGSVAYETYRGDWAIYDGHVETTGRRDVEIVVRTPFEHCTPTSPKCFDSIYFEGAEAGQKLTLGVGCSITPIFSGAVGYGESITFSDVANHDISQAALLEALAHMFNLRFYVHRPSKSIYMEPYDDFFSGDVVDWRDRQHGDISMHECVADSFMVTRLGYLPADGVTSRLSGDKDEVLGEWSAMVNSYATKQSVDSRINPLFMPTATCAGLVSSAPTAELPVVGDRDILSEDDYVTPRILLYQGLVPLPEDETWPISVGVTRYPHVAFHSPQYGETLCFEDRDECEGLHRYYDSELRERATRQLLTTQIYLPPEEYVALFDPAGVGATIRSRFRLTVGGNSSIFRLEEVVSYDTESYMAECRFQRLLAD